MVRTEDRSFKHKEFHYSIAFEFDPLTASVIKNSEALSKAKSKGEFSGFSSLDDNLLIEDLIRKVVELSEGKDFKTFSLGLSWRLPRDSGLNRFKLGLNPTMVKEAERKLAKKADFKAPEAAFLVDFDKKSVFLRLSPLFIRGRYLKFSREIAQTDFFCTKCGGSGCWYCHNTGFFSKDSVEQILSKASVKGFSSLGAILHAAGREDLDVLMLGNGRPFILEVIAPTNRNLDFFDLKKIERELNSKNKGILLVKDLEFCSEKDVAPLKDAHHEKVYSALVSCSTELSPEALFKLPLNEKIFVVQKTPSRVRKRRAALDRKKEVTIIRTDFLGKNLFVVDLRTSHGTYVKEFISGDNSRTSPSLSSMLKNHCQCEMLDVIEIID